jgi:hypothetical protein
MPILKWTTFGREIAVGLTDEPGGEVRIALAGSESKNMVPISTREVAIKDLRAAADWLEGEKEA